MNLLIFAGILSILIVAHEFGHFLIAKLSGVRVEKFSIGFGPTLFERKGKETDFLICMFPLGGYVKMAGESRTDCRGFAYEFFSKPVWVKMGIVFAGPLFNYFLAFVIFWIIAVIAGFLPYQSPVVGKVLKDYPAYHQGIKEGDRVIEVNGRKVTIWVEMAEAIHKSKDKVSLKIKSKGKIVSLDVPVKEELVGDPEKKETISVIGISVKKYSFAETFWRAGETLFNLTFLILKGFVSIISGRIPLKEAITGPVGIYYITTETIKVGITAVLGLMAFLNVSLTIVNLLPLPVLDGGHIFIFLIEKVRGRQLSEKAEDFLTRLGIVILSLLIVFIIYNDVIKFGPKIWKGNKDQPLKIENQEPQK